mmetsp:Transcript_15600/g.36772  ORF Transcript_15600/g.36772 Transcript_15600/m.36772 type:complete len:227 (-) Transcript_15600:485-1165(-)
MLLERRIPAHDDQRRLLVALVQRPGHALCHEGPHPVPRRLHLGGPLRAQDLSDGLKEDLAHRLHIRCLHTSADMHDAEVLEHLVELRRVLDVVLQRRKHVHEFDGHFLASAREKRLEVRGIPEKVIIERVSEASVTRYLERFEPGGSDEGCMLVDVSLLVGRMFRLLPRPPLPALLHKLLPHLVLRTVVTRLRPRLRLSCRSRLRASPRAPRSAGSASRPDNRLIV